MKYGEISEESKRLTIGDIAKELGISKTTVSRAISGKGRISEATRRKVQQYILKHDYRPNLIARSLAQSKTFNIGVVLPEDSNLIETPFFQSCLMGICEVTASFDYDVVVTTATEEDITLLHRLIRNDKVDGVIITRSTTNDLAISYLKGAGIPFVLIGSNEDDEVIQIDNNHLEGCFELTSFLIKAGYGRLALIGGSQRHIVNTNRCQGFLEAFKASELPVDNRLIYLNMTSKVAIEKAVDDLMGQAVDCIVCSDDLICSRVLARLNEKGLHIPADMKVASFYDSSYLASYSPPITTLKVDVKALGIEAGKCLINLIDGKKAAHKTLLDYELIFKKSTM